MIKNPYIYGTHIYDIEKLYGRTDIFNKIKYNFDNEKKITLLHVQRRIGKTSLITCLPQFFTEEQNGFEFVTFSFQSYKYKSTTQILNNLADDITSTIVGLRKEVRETADVPYNFFNIFLPKIIDEYLSGKKLVLLLDEFDVLEEDEKVTDANGRKLFEDLEKAVKEQEKLFAILVFGRPLKDMKYLETFLEEEGQEAIEVGLLDEKSTKDLIVQPAIGKLEYKDDAQEAIWELSAGHPSLTQLLCFCIFNSFRGTGTGEVTRDDVYGYSVLDEAMKKGEAVLLGFLETLNENEKLFFCQVAKGEKIDEYLRPAGKRLVELGFVEEKDTGYKIKVELVRRWLEEYPPIIDNEKLQEENNSKTNQNLTETNNKDKMPMQQQPNPIAKARSLVVLLLILFSLLGYSFVRIRNSLDPKRSRLECSRLLQNINSALRQPKERSGVIEETRKKWSRKKESRKKESLDEQCPYTETDKLDAKYNKLLHLYGFNIIDRGEYEEAISILCEITEEYEESSNIKKDIFVKWISTDGDWDRKKIIEKLIEQNKSGNDCLIYSLKNPRNKYQLYEQRNKQRNEQYYQEAEKSRKDFKFEKAVESYCKISREYDGFDDIVEQLKRWLSDDPDLYPNERQKVEEKLQELNNQCPVSPLNDITN
jgi:adenylate kinase family enzyme